MTTFRVSGSGGQHRDKTSSGVRIAHRASGAVGKSTTERSQAKNKQIAFRRMAESPVFEAWRQLEVARRLGALADVESRVNKMMADENLIVETC